MKSFVFVGERPSERAKKAGVTLKDGKFAAKQLFDALKCNGMEPAEHCFLNVFTDDLTKRERVCYNTLRKIKRLSKHCPIIAMGEKVKAVLAYHSITFVPIIHPAARGAIRKKERYAKHLASQLNKASWP